MLQRAERIVRFIFRTCLENNLDQRPSILWFRAAGTVVYEFQTGPWRPRRLFSRDLVETSIHAAAHKL